MFGRKRPFADFSAELEAHLALEVDRLREQGLSEEEARAQARRNLGNRLASEERFYETGRWLWLDHLAQDTRYALRRLRKTPAFTLTAVLTLALGIGATTAIFTLVNAVMLRSLPVTKPEQLYRVGNTFDCCVTGGYMEQGDFSLVSHELYQHLRDNAPGFEELAAFSADVQPLGARQAGSARGAETAWSVFVSGTYFSTFGIHAFRGRTITPADDRPGAELVAVMSHAAWTEKYGSDPSIVGAIFNLNNKAFRIVGIAPPGFFGESLRAGYTPVLWIPLASEPEIRGDESLINHPNLHWLHMIGRVRLSVSPATVEAQVRVQLRGWLASHVADMTASERAAMDSQTLHLSQGAAGMTSLRDRYEGGLRLLMIVSGFVLLIVCANLANLMLVRGIERRQQTSLSMALGAAPLRLVGQALIESVILALIGGAAGIGVAYAGTSAILRMAFPSAGITDISAGPSLPILVFAFAVSLATGIAFGTAPAWFALRADPVEALRGAGRSTRESGSLARKGLVVLQAAVSLALLCSAGLLTQSLRNLTGQNFGFAREGRWIVRFDPVQAGYRPEQLDSLYRQMHDRLQQIPGVMSVSESIYSPMSGDKWNSDVFVLGQEPSGPKDDVQANWDRISPGYFETVGQRIVRGRPITEQDSAGTQHVAVINEAFARRFFKNEDPIGRHFGKEELKHAGDYEVVGVAADARYFPWDVHEPIGAMFFLPASQSTVYEGSKGASADTRSHYFHIVTLHVAARVQGLEAEVRHAFAAINPDLTVRAVKSVDDMLKEDFSRQGLIARLTSLFGMVALILAAIGVYGITAYGVGRRMAEIGIRMALGADWKSVIILVLRSALALIGIGLALGIPLALALGRYLDSELYGIGRYDPVVLSLAVGVLAITAVAAAFIPARRAASIAPMTALRIE
jgi:predicted permease